MDGYRDPCAFMETELEYRHPARARTLDAVVRFVLNVIDTRHSASEETALREWAVAARPEDHRALHIKGFALAGFQYLRMLFGAQTTKPDLHIVGFVSEVLGRRVSALEALALLENAAPRAALNLRDVDTSIWELRARGASA